MKKHLSTIIMIIIGMAFGAGLALVGISWEWTFQNLLIALIGLIASYILHIIIHEAGHLLFGKLTGYSLVSFRVFSYMVVATENGLRFRKLHVPGTLGQCLMVPPSYEKGQYPFKMYLLGGVILNFSASILVALISVWIGEFYLLAHIFIILGLFIGITNIIPHSFNDGMTLKLAWKDEIKQKQLYAQFYINAKATKGIAYSDLPQELFDYSAGDGSDYFSVWFVCMKHVRAMERMDFQDAKRIMDELWTLKDKLIPMFKMEITKERLFLLMILEGDSKEVREMFADKKLTQYLRLKQMGNKRIQAAYEMYVNKNRNKALHLCEEGLALSKYNPNAADILLERKLIEYIMEDQVSSSLPS